MLTSLYHLKERNVILEPDSKFCTEFSIEKSDQGVLPMVMARVKGQEGGEYGRKRPNTESVGGSYLQHSAERMNSLTAVFQQRLFAA